MPLDHFEPPQSGSPSSSFSAGSGLAGRELTAKEERAFKRRRLQAVALMCLVAVGVPALL